MGIANLEKIAGKLIDNGLSEKHLQVLSAMGLHQIRGQ